MIGLDEYTSCLYALSKCMNKDEDTTILHDVSRIKVHRLYDNDVNVTRQEYPLHDDHLDLSFEKRDQDLSFSFKVDPRHCSVVPVVVFELNK